MSARWPKALRSVTVVPGRKAKVKCDVHLVAAHGAYCEDCGWKGPLRREEIKAFDDREVHLAAGCWR